MFTFAFGKIIKNLAMNKSLRPWSVITFGIAMFTNSHISDNLLCLNYLYGGIKYTILVLLFVLCYYGIKQTIEKSIIIMRYFQEKTQVEIAGKLGISQVQVSRMEKKILISLRKKII